MAILIKNGLVYSKINGSSTFTRNNIIVSDNIISNISEDVYDESKFTKVINAKNCIVIPGIINAHLHSHDHFNKGKFDNLPLEIWMMELRPLSTGMTHTAEEIYLRTLYGCIEMLRTGTTTIIDDIVQTNLFDEEKITSVLQAYEDAGIRGYITTMTSDKNMYETIPYLDVYFSDDDKKTFTKTPPDVDEICAFQESLIKSRISKIMKYAISPSGAQRCSDKLMTRLSELSRKYHVPAVCHVLETKMQAVTGQYFYGDSLLNHMKKIGALHENFNLIHTVYATADDIDIMREFNCKMVHNPISNLKLGNGIAPIKEILNAGISVGLGTDNTSCNDSINMFESLKFAATLHKIRDDKPEEWVSAEDVFDMATVGGTECALMRNEIGKLEIGYKADITIIDIDNDSYIPSCNLLNSLVFCHRGSNVKDVLIDGKVVLEDYKILSFDEKAVLTELKERLPRFIAENDKASMEAQPYIAKIRKAYDRACADLQKLS